MNFSGVPLLGALVCLVSGAVVLAADAQQQERPQENQDELVVTGKRDERRLQGGEWTISLSRAYRQGHVDATPVGRDRSWKFCLSDADVEPLMRILVGEGRTASSATTTCSPLVLQLGDGRLRGTQSCLGGSMRPVEVETHRGVDSLAMRSGGGGGGQPCGNNEIVPAKNTLSVTGRYTRDRLVIDFRDVQQPVCPSASYLTRPDVLNWSIKGQRVGDCRLEPSSGE